MVKKKGDPGCGLGIDMPCPTRVVEEKVVKPR